MFCMKQIAWCQSRRRFDDFHMEAMEGKHCFDSGGCIFLSVYFLGTWCSR